MSGLYKTFFIFGCMLVLSASPAFAGDGDNENDGEAASANVNKDSSTITIPAGQWHCPPMSYENAYRLALHEKGEPAKRAAELVAQNKKACDDAKAAKGNND